MSTLTKRILMGVAGAGLLLVGMTIGVIFSGSFQAFAAGNIAGANAQSTAGDGQYCQLYEQTLAKDLGVSQSKLESANKDALKTTLDQMVKDGKITAAQESKIEARLAKSGEHPCAALAAAAREHRGGPAGPAQQALMNAHSAVESAVAAKLNISTATLESDLSNGQTIPQIAQAQHVNLSDVNTAYLNAVQAQLKQAVSNGTITQAQSDMLYARIQNAIAAGHYPLLEHGGPGGGAAGAGQ